MFSNSIIHQAPLKIIGYWKNKDLRQTHVYPHPKDFVDEEWETAIRQKVIECLENGVIHNYQRGFSTCCFSGKLNGNSELTDGVLLWPEGLAHYLKNYNVRLPQPVVDHFLGYQYNRENLAKKSKLKHIMKLALILNIGKSSKTGNHQDSSVNGKSNLKFLSGKKMY